MSRRVIFSSEVKVRLDWSRRETESEQGEQVSGSEPEAARSIHEQVEAPVKRGGGPNRCLLKKSRMTCG